MPMTMNHDASEVIVGKKSQSKKALDSIFSIFVSAHRSTQAFGSFKDSLC